MEQNWRATRRWIFPMVKNYIRLDIIILDAMILRIVNDYYFVIKTSWTNQRRETNEK
jgi:hypothetical protein